jgi:hypothetical protein
MAYAPGYGPMGFCPAVYGRAQTGQPGHVRRCQRLGCRKEVAGGGPAAKFCAEHAAASTKASKREYQRRRREQPQPGPRVEKLPSAALVI